MEEMTNLYKQNKNIMKHLVESTENLMFLIEKDCEVNGKIRRVLNTYCRSIIMSQI